MKKRKRVIAAAVLAVILFAVGFYIVFFIRLVKVPTGSMKNTILPGDRVAVNIVFRQIERGDIVIFKFPMDPSVQFIQRVIGLPGESIRLRDKRVYINGNELSERRVSVERVLPDDPSPMKELSADGGGSYSVLYNKADPGDLDLSDDLIPYGIKEPFQIPEGSYFVMGDNRDNSLDSRFWGVVPRDSITGKAFLIYWSEDPLDKKTRWDRTFSRLR